jgi:SLOG cluster2/TIR domain
MSKETLAPNEYQPRLLIYVVWHPAFERGQKLAESIYAHFSRDPERTNARGLGIPVFFRSAAAAQGKAPPPIAVDAAQHTAIVVLVDPQMVIAEGWDAYVAELWKQAGAAPDRHRLFPVAFDDTAYQLSPQIGAVNFIRLQGHSPDAGPGFLLNRLTNELGRLLTQRPTLAIVETKEVKSPPKMQLFISHAKLDGEKTAILLRDYIHDNLALDTFFDAIDIAAGFRFEDEINAGIDTAAFVVVHTDAYASRVWCQHEVIRAKRHGRPVVVIHAIEEGEARSFPYIGNVPTIRWRSEEPARLEAVIGLVLREVLRSEYFQQHFDDLKKLFGVPDKVRALPRAPELLTCLALRAESDQVPYFVYPDPPLAKLELDLLIELDPNLRLTTPTLLFARPSQPFALAGQKLEDAAAGWRTGLSISDSADLPLRGFGPAHLRDAAAEFARFLLAAGATLAYGGDLRQGGFTEVLFELLTAYRAISGEAVDAIQSYLAWPIHLDLDVTQRARLKNTARLHEIPPPANLGIDAAGITSAKQVPPTTPENRVAWARSLTAMRERMNAEIHARLLLGGQARGLGKYPGLAEEALLALRAGKPVYLIGAFGGCAEAVIEALRGNKPAALTLDYQATEDVPRAAIELYNSQVPPGGEPIDYPALTAEFEKVGVAGLNNGLDAEENERLCTTMHLPEMIALVLRGLGRLGKPPALAS